MPEYMTTKEVAKYLRLNEKKVYDLVARKQLPAARISGKWLFPQNLIDQWVAENTVYPSTGLMGAVLEDMVIIQGSDDWLLARAAERYQERHTVPVVSTRVGSLAGLEAIGSGHAHLAGCHVGNEEVVRALHGQGCCLVTLFERSQGLIYDGERHADVGGLADAGGLADLADSGLRFAARQVASGTHQLTCRLLGDAGVDADALPAIGPFSSHLELALAILRGEADVGMGTALAAELCGLDFHQLHSESYKVAVPLGFVAHPRLAGFLEFVLEDLQAGAGTGVTGYGFGHLGRMEMLERGGAAAAQDTNP